MSSLDRQVTGHDCKKAQFSQFLSRTSGIGKRIITNCLLTLELRLFKISHPRTSNAEKNQRKNRDNHQDELEGAEIIALSLHTVVDMKEHHLDDDRFGYF